MPVQVCGFHITVVIIKLQVEDVKANHLPQGPQLTSKQADQQLTAIGRWSNPLQAESFILCVCVFLHIHICVCVCKWEAEWVVSLYPLVAYWHFHIEGQLPHYITICGWVVFFLSVCVCFVMLTVAEPLLCMCVYHQPLQCSNKYIFFTLVIHHSIKMMPSPIWTHADVSVCTDSEHLVRCMQFEVLDCSLLSDLKTGAQLHPSKAVSTWSTALRSHSVHNSLSTETWPTFTVHSDDTLCYLLQ